MNPKHRTRRLLNAIGWVFMSAAVSLAPTKAAYSQGNSWGPGTAHNVRIHGKTYAKWSKKWWQWQEANYPDFDFGTGVIDCTVGQAGAVWFLAGTGGGPAEERQCDTRIRGHKHFFFPLVNFSFWNPDESLCPPDDFCTVGEKRAIVDGLLSEEPPGAFNSAACKLQVTVDDAPAVFSVPIVRVQSPPFEYAGDPEAISDGFWVMLGPLARGRHVIRFTGGVCDLDTGDVVFSVDVTYDLRTR